MELETGNPEKIIQTVFTNIVAIEYDNKTHIEKSQRYKWCTEKFGENLYSDSPNNKGRYVIKNDNAVWDFIVNKFHLYCFKYEKDAMLFKLTWG